MKVWDGNSGKQKLFMESTSNFNDFCTIPNSGLFFFAQEEAKMQTNYVPSLGNAPKWCSFLDKLTEEIEAESVQNIYDDYKFVTRQELQQLNLDDLEGTDLLKAYMHGFFVNMKLYLKAKANNRDTIQKKPSKKAIEKEEPEKRLQIRDDLPKVNQKMALQIIKTEEENSSKKKNTQTAMSDNRFKAMFENEDFQIDEETEEYRRSFKSTGESWASAKKQKLGKRALSESPERSDNSDAGDIKIDKRAPSKKESKLENISEKFKLTAELGNRTQTKKSLAKRLEAEQKNSYEITNVGGNRQMVFDAGEKSNEALWKIRKEKQKHHEERKKVIRTAKFKFK